MRTLNLGILAHVDAGKTTLSERLLYAAGVIDQPGSVDKGSTQTDTLALERRRGITIRSAVVSFTVGDRQVNLIDTPGHPDFIAEVERVLGVLDGAVLVVSAVAGVQAQTKVLMRTLRRLRIPTLLFVNKIDSFGARDERLVNDLAGKLTPGAVAMGSVRDPGSRRAAFEPFTGAEPGFLTALLDRLAEHDDDLLAAYVRDESALAYPVLRAALAVQTARALVHPVFFGSAVTGAGVAELTAGIRDLLPAAHAEQAEHAAHGGAGGPAAGVVFKVERGPAGEKIAYVRMVSGTLRVRDRVRLPGGRAEVVTSIRVFDQGGATGREAVAAGQIAKVWGLSGVRIGDRFGAATPAAPRQHFAPPTLETVVYPRRAADATALHTALTQLAEQDPLIDLRRDRGGGGDLRVSLYGEVQREVLQATLAEEYGLAVGFRDSTTICVERPVGTGAAVEVMHQAPNPFLATVGLRVEPGPPGSGVTFRLAVELGSMPYAFFRAVEETVTRTLREGLYGWQVVDCQVTMTHSGYAPRQSHSHARFDKSMSSTGEDFRGLTPLVVTSALRQAGTEVREPVHRFQLELPADAVGTVLPVLPALGAVPVATEVRGSEAVVSGEVPAARVTAVRRRLPGLTRGEGVLACEFDHYAPVRGPAPTRPRTDHNPLHRAEYLLRTTRRI